MALPAAVQAQEDAANMMMDGGQQGNPSNEAPQRVQPVQQPAQQQPAQPQQAPENAQVAQALQQTPQSDDFDKLQHRFNVLKGKLDTELPKAAEQIKLLQEENQQLKSQTQAKESSKDLDEAMSVLADELGDKALGALGAYLRSQAQQEIAPLKQELAHTRQQTEEVQQSSLSQAQAAYVSGLDSLAPNWAALNVDQGFNHWLSNTARDGKTLHQIINEKANALDAAGVAKIFREYQPEQLPIEGHIMPGRGGSGGNQNINQGQQSYSPEEIDAVYKGYVKGTVTQEQFEAFEASIQQGE